LKARNVTEKSLHPGSSKYPASKKTREGDSSPIRKASAIPNEESKGQELMKSLELSVGNNTHTR